MPTFNVPIDRAHFSLDTSGVAGFFGGDEAISAMATGSYTVAKKFGQLANSRFWDGLFPGPNLTPAEAFGLDGQSGPRYWGVLSGTDMPTGHLGYLVVQKAKGIKEEVKVGGRETTARSVTIIDVDDVILKDSDPASKMSLGHALLACIPITVSLATCTLSAASGDWLAFGLILLGMVSSGTSCFVIGSAQVHFVFVKDPSPGSPPADGLLFMANDVVIVRGAEKDINPITKGRFVLKMDGGPEFNRVGLCSLLLLMQFLVQLLFVPQASTFGQIMFISSLAASWAYNSFLSSLEQEKIQLNILWKALGHPRIVKFGLKSRAAQAVFVCSVLSNGVQRPSVNFKPKKILHTFVSNDTRVWNIWRDKVAEQLTNDMEKKNFEASSSSLQGLEDDERKLLGSLLRDAQNAYRGYQDNLHKLRDNRHISRRSHIEICVS